MRDALDDVLFEYGRAVRQDAEAAVDPDAALLDHVERLQIRAVASRVDFGTLDLALGGCRRAGGRRGRGRAARA